MKDTMMQDFSGANNESIAQKRAVDDDDTDDGGSTTTAASLSEDNDYDATEEDIMDLQQETGSANNTDEGNNNTATDQQQQEEDEHQNDCQSTFRKGLDAMAEILVAIDPSLSATTSAPDNKDDIFTDELALIHRATYVLEQLNEEYLRNKAALEEKEKQAAAMFGGP